MAAEKQIDAAQKFLRGIQSLASYEEVRDKQAQGVQRSLEKLYSFIAAQAASWLRLLQADLWTVGQLDSFRELVAAKTRPVEVESNRGGVTQDFTLLPYYLSDDLAQDVGNAATDSDRLLCRLCQHAAKMTLRNASEATKATIVVLAKWNMCKRGLSPRQQHELFCRFKPVVTKYLTAAEDSKYLLDLPVAWEELDQDIVTRVFPTGKPTQITDLAAEICNYVRHMPLRKDNRLLQSSSHALPSSGQVPPGFLAVEDICGSMQISATKCCDDAVEPSRSFRIMRADPPQLAICDRPPVEAAESVEPKPAATMSVAEQLAALRADMDPPMEAAARGGKMKKPAASQKRPGTLRPRGRPPGTGKPRAVRKAGLTRPAVATSKDTSMGREQDFAMLPTGAVGSKRSNVAKASAMPKGKIKTSKKPEVAKRSSKGKVTVTPKGANVAASDRAARRQAILASVPKKIQAQYRKGCSKCRYTRCTVSCWRSRGFELPPTS
jgi:hypothetical protein